MAENEPEDRDYIRVGEDSLDERIYRQRGTTVMASVRSKPFTLYLDNSGHFASRVSGQAGDAIVVTPTGNIQVMSAEDFEKLYELHDATPNAQKQED